MLDPGTCRVQDINEEMELDHKREGWLMYQAEEDKNFTVIVQ